MRLPTPVLVVLLGAAFVTLMGLGIWQLQRNDWKQNLVAESHARTDAPPLDVTDATGLAADDMAYRRIHLEGEWRLDDVMFLANRARYSVRGEEILLPVQPAEGPAVLVNLGWIPDGARADVMAQLAERAGEPIDGLGVDATGRNGRRIPSGSWSNIDTDTMGEALGYNLVSWFVLAGPERTSDPNPNDPLPVDGWQRFHNTTPHMEYALTWFGIAAALVAIAVFRLVIAPRREAQARPPAPGGGGDSPPTSS
ncbi:MAG: SURF1 family protein [Dehalococcoidia bacterium]|nr:SURF1 family protein [Dehalococcoidia bacterium]MCB9483324.1 SURF1 family protein [Dehalococcoidia bacterium]MCB9492141.1 SURF1 family protein [Dehalococcoidia bacterium]